MIFSRTKQSLQNLQRQSSLTLGEMFAVMQDVMQDIQDETGSGPAQLPPDDTALQKWRTVAHALLRMPMEDAAVQLSEKQQQRMQMLQKELSERHAGTAEMQTELEQGAAELERLNAEAAALQKLKQQREMQAADLEDARREVESLQKSLDAMPETDADALMKQRAVIEQELQSRKQQQAELESLRTQAAEMQAEADAARAARDSAESALNDLHGQLQSLNEETERLRQTHAEIEDAQLPAAQHALTDAQHALASKNAELEQLQAKTAALTEAADETGGRLAELCERCSEIQAAIEKQKAEEAAAEQARADA